MLPPLPSPLLMSSEGVSPPEVLFMEQRPSNASLTTYSFSTVAFGTPTADRQIIVCIRGYRDVGGNITGVTIGGVTATIEVNTSIGLGSIAIARANVPSGSSGTVAVTFSVLQAGCDIIVYRVGNLTSTTPVAVLTDTTSPLSQNISPPANSIAIAHAGSGGNGSFTWSGTAGLTENADGTYAGSGTSATHSAASKTFNSSASGVAVTAGFSTTLSNPGMHVIVYN